MSIVDDFIMTMLKDYHKLYDTHFSNILMITICMVLIDNSA